MAKKWNNWVGLIMFLGNNFIWANFVRKHQNNSEHSLENVVPV